jgi:hypothetical protein
MQLIILFLTGLIHSGLSYSADAPSNRSGAKKLIETKGEDYVPAFDFARKAGIDLAGCIYMTN